MVTERLKRMDETVFELDVVTERFKRMKGTGGLVRFGLLLVMERLKRMGQPASGSSVAAF